MIGFMCRCGHESWRHNSFGECAAFLCCNRLPECTPQHRQHDGHDTVFCWCRRVEQICGDYNTVGSQCTQPRNHDGPHRASHGATWTDESNQRAATWMTQQGGKD